MAKEKKANRELHQVWLRAAAVILKRELLPDYPVDTVASYGFPTGRNADDSRGACYKPDQSGRASVILIHPSEWNNAKSVLRTFVHEAIHAELQQKGVDDGHGERFASIARRIGLDGELFDTPDEVLSKWIDETIEVLPPMPEDPLGRTKGRGPQKGRMRLWVCSCNFKIRTGRKDLDATCNLCNAAFELAEEKKKEGGE
jgi:hypothetical protein